MASTPAHQGVASEGETPAPVRLLVADDHDLYRRGLAVVIGADSHIEIVGEARDGSEAIAKSIELQPDVVVMDIAMPSLSGIEACRRIRDEAPSIRILMLTMSEDETDLFAAIKAGASGYLLKDVPAEEISAAVVATHNGQSLVPPSMAATLLAEFVSLSRRVDNPGVATPRLTERELEVLRLLARGMSNRDIAKELFIAENTVKNHVRNILEKLQLHSRIEAALYAVREKIIDNPA